MSDADFLIDESPLPATLPACRGDLACSSCGVEPCVHAVRTHEAIALIQAGARAPQVRQLTNLPDKYIKRLYKSVRGKASPRGMSPYSDAWFIENEHRMLHATVVWQLYQQLLPHHRSAARTLLDLQQLYHFHVPTPLLDFTHINAALQLAGLKVWDEKRCRECRLIFIGPKDDPVRKTCPSCKLYHRYRCQQCGGALSPHAQGRPRTCCERCSGNTHH